MKKDLLLKIEVPQGIKVNISKNKIELEKDGEKLERKFSKINIKLEGNKLIIEEKKADRSKKKLARTLEAHIKNIIKGLEKKWFYKLQICFVHFPTTVEIKDKEVIIKNFLGEILPRKAKILENVSVKKEDDFLIIESNDKEAAGQTAANIESATKVGNKDRRIFQDGIFMVNKGGKEI